MSRSRRILQCGAKCSRIKRLEGQIEELGRLGTGHAIVMRVSDNDRRKDKKKMTARFQATKEGMTKGFTKIVDSLTGQIIRTGKYSLKVAHEIAKEMSAKDLRISGSSWK